MCACEHGFTCDRCKPRARADDALAGLDDDDRERFAEMMFADEWPDRIAPALADLEPRP